MKDKTEIQSAVLDRWIISSRTEVGKWMEKNIGWSKVSSWHSMAMESMVYELRAYMTKQAEKPLMKTIQWPETWWEHLKEAKAPAWFKEKWPVIYHTEEVIADPQLRICPHLKQDSFGKHVAHILMEDTK